MTHDQTTPAPVDVTQGDRDRATRVTMWPIGSEPYQTLAREFARHRIAHSAPAGEVEPVACKYPVHGCVTHHRNGVEHCDFCGSPADQEPTTHPAPPADLVELVEAADTPLVGAWMLLEHKVLAATGALSDSEWRPDRSHIEGMQRTMQQAIEEIAQARAALAKHGGA